MKQRSLGALDEVGADAVADAARARVQHHPHPVALVEADLDEVVAGAECAQMLERRALTDLRMLLDDRLQALGERCPAVYPVRPGLRDLGRHVLPGAPVALDAAAAGAPVRHRRLDRRAQTGEAVRQLLRRQRRRDRHHAATDVDADRRRHDRPLARNDAADGRTQAPVHVRHDGDVMMHERQARDVLQLPARLRLDRHPRRPRLDRRALGCNVLVPVHDRSSTP
jgi:hypothetical protein